MSVKAYPAVEFKCEKCGRDNFAEYTLENDREDGREVMADNIMCEYCGHENRVIMEL